MDIEKLKNPPVKYRPVNYWGWLGNIQPEESARQAEEMRRAGLGGFVAHARGGHEVPYMGEDWMNSVHAVVETAKKYGMLAIIDDEDGWPSGFGAGTVNGKGEDYWVKWLVCEPCDVSFKPGRTTLGVYDAAGERLHISYGYSEYYVDNMDPKVVDAFIEAAYESYYTRFGNEFGKGYYGVFSDEPQLARYAVPWSFTLPDEFKKRWGYELTPNLPALFRDIEGHERVRYHFWRTCAELFECNYGKRIGDWCRERNLVFTGHTTLEEFLPMQMQCSGSTMRFYEQFDIPGMDWLTRKPVSNLAVKQLASVAQQLGKERTLSEMYGCAGWNVSFEDMKWIAEQHYVLGVDFLLQHLGLYSLKGSRKREYPASLFFQQPWWKDYNAFNDYFARLSLLMAESSPVIDLLVIHPMASAWTGYKGDNSKTVEPIESELNALTDRLLSEQFDFHYGDEELLRRHGSVRGGRVEVGKMSYGTVILPSMTTIDASTTDLLISFAKAGGRLLSAGGFPLMTEGVPGGRLDELRGYTETVAGLDNLVSTLEKHVERPMTAKSRSGGLSRIHACTKVYDGRTMHFIVNTNRDEAQAINIAVASGKNLSMLDLEMCEERPFTGLDIRLEPTESLLLFECDGERALGEIGKNAMGGNAATLDGKWSVTSRSLNALTLDRCAYSFDGGEWQPEKPVILLQQALIRGRKNGRISMEFRVTSGFAPDDCWLVLEEPDKCDIEVNGQTVEARADGWWIDKSFEKIYIGGLLKEGENRIRVTRDFYLSEKVYSIKNDPDVHEAESNRVTFETELESVYLLGDFSVDMPAEVTPANLNSYFTEGPFVMTKPRGDANVFDLSTDGFAFFAGTVKLKKSFDWSGGERALLSFERPDAIVVKASVNGKDVRTFGWAPYEADISEFLVDGENTVELELTNSLRNLLGPHHHKAGEMTAVGPYSFGIERDTWNDPYNLVRFGIAGGVRITAE